MRLTKGVFDGANPQESLFGLRSGVYKDPGDFIHNGGWYNAAGEKLGSGDLALEDFGHITAGLEEGELFVVLLERDVFGAVDAETPGDECVAEFCVLLIGPGTIYVVIPEESHNITMWSLGVLDPLAGFAMRSGVKISIIDRKWARKMLLGHNGTFFGRLLYGLRKRFEV